MVLLASSSHDLQLVLGLFAAKCEEAGMRISTSKFEAMALSWKGVECTHWIQNESLPRVEKFKHMGVCSQVKGEGSIRLTEPW